jgi:murein DD-endopeptidase MepM/ murein hydrolase activator NlpD
VDLHKRHVLAALCGLLLAIAPLLPTVRPADAAEEDERLEETRRQGEEARSRLSNLRQSDEELAAALEAAEAALQVVNAELAAAESAHAAAEAQLEVGLRELAEAEQRVAAAEDELRRRAARAYAQPQPLLDALLVASDPLELAKRTALAQAVLEGDVRAVDELEAARAERDRAVEQLNQAVIRAAAARDEAIVRRDQVAIEQAELEALRQELQARIEAQRAEVQALEQQEAELVAIIREREAAAAAAAAAADKTDDGDDGDAGDGGAGGMCWPTSQGWVSSEFGPRWGRNHNGIDIAAPTGTGVRAAAGGVVFHAAPFGSFGNFVAIDHGDGVTTFYAHLNSIEVYEGQWVSCGERVAGVGSTGRSTGPHLHFEVRVGGVPQDPRGYVG